MKNEHNICIEYLLYFVIVDTSSNSEATISNSEAIIPTSEVTVSPMTTNTALQCEARGSNVIPALGGVLGLVVIIMTMIMAAVVLGLVWYYQGKLQKTVSK